MEKARRRNVLITVIRSVVVVVLLWLCVAVFVGDAGVDVVGAERVNVTVMSFNIYGGGAQRGVPLSRTVAAIRAVQPDIVGLQETRQEGPPPDYPPVGPWVTADLVLELKNAGSAYYAYNQEGNNSALWANTILSRYPIQLSDNGDVIHSPNNLGIRVRISDHVTVAVYNIHLASDPYQPYQVMRYTEPYLYTPQQAIQSAIDTRGNGTNLLLSDVTAFGKSDIAFVFGDFNEPSHRDWTAPAVRAGLQPWIVQWPTTLTMENAHSFSDLYRLGWPDVVSRPGFSWTSMPQTPVHYDRIDMMLGWARGQMEVTRAGIVGEKAPEADIVIRDFPSDHRAMFATVSISV
eukprot:TRINITY_DN6630_c0_g1_i1.p1 TRINITY_DN6630_c0_g1~~TRINITY_DN6630_c0_g1_i1.p1  ORF type:complete len:347 (+),score=33.46 TRINITY_DN6630_c0_g1_i1:1-1041(+)